MGRQRSMKVDGNDANRLRHGRMKHLGTCVSQEFYQRYPVFLSREGCEVDLVGIYRGAAAFLIASGPSFQATQHDLLRRAGVWSMTINNAVCSFRGDAAIIVDDPSRFVLSMWLDPKIAKFVPHAAMDKPLWDSRAMIDARGQVVQCWRPAGVKVGDCPNVLGYRRNEKFHADRYLYEDTINWGNHKDFGGGRSVMLAAMRILFLLGFRKVYLVGVDFEMNPDKKYHFEEGRTPGAVKCNNDTYDKMKQWFAELKPYFDAEGFLVKNCNPQSQLKVFPFTTLEEAVYEAAAHLGDVKQERSLGMYSKYEEKLQEWERQKLLAKGQLGISSLHPLSQAGVACVPLAAKPEPVLPAMLQTAQAPAPAVAPAAPPPSPAEPLPAQIGTVDNPIQIGGKIAVFADRETDLAQLKVRLAERYGLPAKADPPEPPVPHTAVDSADRTSPATGFIQDDFEEFEEPAEPPQAEAGLD
jgi:hypothetical protein